jgi:hypothetical protein
VEAEQRYAGVADEYDLALTRELFHTLRVRPNRFNNIDERKNVHLFPDAQ